MPPRKKAPARNPGKVTAAPTKLTLRKVPDPSTLTFAEMYRIKAATGVDVLDPPTRGHAIAAVLWLSSRDDEHPLTWEQAQEYRLDLVDLTDDLDELLDRDDDEEPDADPTDGHETPSSE